MMFHNKYINSHNLKPINEKSIRDNKQATLELTQLIN